MILVSWTSALWGINNQPWFLQILSTCQGSWCQELDTPGVCSALFHLLWLLSSKWCYYNKILIRNQKEYKSSGVRGPAPGHEGENSSGGAWESLADPGGLPENGSGFLSPGKLQDFRDQWGLMTRGLEQYIYYNFKLKSDGLVRKQANNRWSQYDQKINPQP